jgi:beta-galactosidase
LDDVVYQPGELKAGAYKAGAKLGEKVVTTAGPPAAIRLTPDRTSLKPTGDDLSFILVEAVDAKSNPAPLADNLVEFELQGPGEIAGVDDGDQTSYEPFQDNRHKLFYGKATLIVRTREGQPGSIRVKAVAKGLKPGTASLAAQ